LNARDEKEIENAFVTLARDRPDALLVGSDPVFDVFRDKIVALVGLGRDPRRSISFRDFTTAGGLMSYDPDILDAYRQIGAYTPERSSRGAPARRSAGPAADQIPACHQPQDREGPSALKFPANLLARADEVIE